MLFGIGNQAPRVVVGTKFIEDPAATTEWIFDKLGFRVRIEAVDHPDGRVVVITIPGRPRGSLFHLDGKYLMRVGESLQPMSEDQLRTILVEASPDWIEEPIVSHVNAARVLALLDTYIFFERLGLSYPSTTNAVIERLSRERLIIDDGEGEYSIRRIAALVLAKELNAFPDLERKAPRVVAYNGSTKVADPIHTQIGAMGYAVGFQGLLKFVKDKIPHKEIIKNGLRTEEYMIPEIAIRELLSNALVHQDLTIPGTSVLIELFDNRMEVSNPGQPIVPLDRLINEVRSRNERLADLMRRMRICEERGSGIDKVVNAVEVMHLPAPEFRAMDNRTVFTVHGPRTFNEMDRGDRVRACYQHCALKFEFSERMTNQSLRERFKLPESKIHLVSQVISATIEDGLIKPDEKAGASKKFARYVPHWV